MDLQEISATGHVRAVGHDPREDTLTVQFANGRIYQFDGVPANIHEQMMEADSPGRFFHQWVKPYYGSSEVTEK